MPKPDAGLEQRVDAIRRFNRMYMHRIGILEERVFDSAFTVAELRVLTVLSLGEATTASALARDLKMDNGYLSRILTSFEKQGLVEKERSKEDARQYKLTLSKKGQTAADDVNAVANKIMMNIVAPLPVEDQLRLVSAMSTIDRIVNQPGRFEKQVMAPFTIRPHRLGDMGRIIHSCAVQFAADYGWNYEFEAELATLAGDFIRKYNPATDRCWIAEINGLLVGSVFLRAVNDNTAEAVLPYVTPEARGMGIGRHLLESAKVFAKDAGYKKILLRTESVVDFAGTMLKQAGLSLVRETPHHRFGRESVGQDWELILA
ncbi:MAG: bifunctional helix-turn-helix transcriptional regulator/GNAT family N-acetyltransferase [bacterium]|nr:bifunctional helix-turn-helix transcriptional regulator/GNAT family N-acetyltransferase [bacterium]